MEAHCWNMENGDEPPFLQFFHQWNASDPKPQESSPALPAQPETPNDGHLAGLLTYASWNLKRLPGTFPVACCSGSQRIQLRGSGGFSPRFPLPDGGSYRRRERQSQEREQFNLDGSFPLLPDRVCDRGEERGNPGKKDPHSIFQPARSNRKSDRG